MKKKKAKTPRPAVEVMTEYLEEAYTTTQPVAVKRNLYAEEMVNDFEKIAKHVIGSVDLLIDSNVELAKVGEKLLEYNEQYKQEILACRADAAKLVNGSKSLADAAFVQGDIAKTFLDSNISYMLHFTDFMKEFHQKFIEGLNRNAEYATSRIKDTCHLSDIYQDRRSV